MQKRFIFIYFMKEEFEKIQPVISSHIKYWEDLNLNGYSGGPFSDRSGGLIIFEAEDNNEAIKIAMSDPFIINNLIEHKWIKEWAVE